MVKNNISHNYFYANRFIDLTKKLLHLISNVIKKCTIIIIFHYLLVHASRLVMSLPAYTQRLLVLLFGTFRVIATCAEKAGTGMTSEALGVSVAPSFLHSCVADGKAAKMEDVMRFKVSHS